MCTIPHKSKTRFILFGFFSLYVALKILQLYGVKFLSMQEFFPLSKTIWLNFNPDLWLHFKFLTLQQEKQNVVIIDIIRFYCYGGIRKMTIRSKNWFGR